MSMNLITLATAREFTRKFIENGSCNNDVLDVRIAEAEQRLWYKMPARLSRRIVLARVQHRQFCLPLEVESIIGVTVDSYPSNLFHQGYEFMQSGPGELDAQTFGTGVRDLVDMGEFPTMFDVPVILTRESDEDICEASTGDGYPLLAFSEYAADTTPAMALTIRGLDSSNDEIHTDIESVWTPGEVLLINRWHNGTEGSIYGQWTDLRLTTNEFRQVTQVYKPVSKGPVCLYAVDTTTHQLYFLSKMIPSATIPMYRRFRITNMGCQTEDDGAKPCAAVRALVQLRYTPPTLSTDVMRIQNLSALKNMCISIQFENTGDFRSRDQYEGTAVRILAEEKQMKDAPVGMPAIIDVAYEASSAGLSHGYRI